MVESVVFDVRGLCALSDLDQPIFSIPSIDAGAVARHVAISIVGEALPRTATDHHTVVCAVGVPAWIDRCDRDRVRASRQSHRLLKARADLRSLRRLPCNRHRRFLCGRPGKTDHPTAAQRGELVDVVEGARTQDLIAPFGRPVVSLVVGVAAEGTCGGELWLSGILGFLN